MRTGGAWCSRCSSVPKSSGKRSAVCPSCARPWMPSRIRSTACSSTAVAAAGQVPGSRAGRSLCRARGPFRCPGPQTSRIWIWRLTPRRPRRTPGRRWQGRYSGRRVHGGKGLAGMMLADTVPVLRPPVCGTEELAATGRSVTGRECLKRSQAPEPPGVRRGCCPMRDHQWTRADQVILYAIPAPGLAGSRVPFAVESRHRHDGCYCHEYRDLV